MAAANLYGIASAGPLSEGANAEAFVAYGVTSLHDPGGALSWLNAMQDRSELTSNAVPRDFYSGEIFEGDIRFGEMGFFRSLTSLWLIWTMTHFALNPRDKKAAEKDITALGSAAQYLRMSTEYQEYSIANQPAAIALYPAVHDLGIVRAFVDAGKTGTTLRHRRGLQELIRTVESGAADFDHIIVYDVSRWGRFPDSDESAYYEYLCKRAGISVHYCAEQFENDNSPTSNLLKGTMAGEYGRELGVKVSVGQRRLASMGFWQGGGAPFGISSIFVM
jgi:hypothetical protein